VTDREAIRQITGYLDFLLQHTPLDVETHDQRIALKQLYRDLAEPAAPAVTICCECGRRVETEEDGGPETQLRDGRWVCCEGCWDKAVGSVDAPTVTREQAEHAKAAISHYFDTKDFDWPAFFRAVADALEGE
jgi:hypothetical protein